MSTHKKKDRKRKEAAFLFYKVFFLEYQRVKKKNFFNSSRRAMLYKNCARIKELVHLLKKQIVHAKEHRRRRILFRGWNGQAVWKFKESTVKTIRIKIKTASESVNR